MKEVIAVYVDGEFKQYLLKSEVRYVVAIMNATKSRVCCELTQLTARRYALEFGKPLKENI